jgi:hypothetical protein
MGIFKILRKSLNVFEVHEGNCGAKYENKTVLKINSTNTNKSAEQ